MFAVAAQMTDVFEGSLIRVFRRLQELIRQMALGTLSPLALFQVVDAHQLFVFAHAAAKAIGSEELEQKFNDALGKLERHNSVAFAASLVRSAFLHLAWPIFAMSLTRSSLVRVFAVLVSGVWLSSCCPLAWWGIMGGWSVCDVMCMATKIILDDCVVRQQVGGIDARDLERESCARARRRHRTVRRRTTPR